MGGDWLFVVFVEGFGSGLLMEWVFFFLGEGLGCGWGVLIVGLWGVWGMVWGRGLGW